MKVDVYYNLHRKCLSIRSRETETYGRVIAHKPSAFISNARFVVQPAGLKKARDTGVKNVHAFVRGEWDGEPVDISYGEWSVIRYNPFKWDGFVSKVDGENYSVVESADVAIIVGDTMVGRDVRAA